MKKNSLLLPLFIKYEVVFASVLIICFVVISTIVLLIPNLEKMDSIISENKVLQTKIERLKNKEEILSQIQSENYKARYTKAQSILPEVSDYVSILNTLDALTQKSGASIVSTDFKTAADPGSLGTSNTLIEATSSGTPIWITLGVSGSYEQLNGFLSGLNKIDGRLFNIYQANYSKSDDGHEELKLVTSTYSYKLNTELGAVDSPLPVIDQKKKSILSSIDLIPDIKKNNGAISTMSGKPDLFN